MSKVHIKKQGVDVSTYCFTAHKEFVWGATAKIMMQLSV